MKRGRPPKRTKGLHVDPEKVRAFLKRGRGQLGRSKGPRRKKPQRPKEGPLTPTQWRHEVWQLDGRRSIVTGLPVSYGRAHFHHVIAKQELRRRGLFDKVWDPRNGVTTTASEHTNHEFGNTRIPLEKLPERTRSFARELGPWAEARLERAHPPAGRSGNDRRR